MQILAVGNPRRGNAGFTLLELLVVLAIVAIASVGVGFAMRDTSQVQLERDAERLAALLESARARSQVSGVPVRWQGREGSFHFDGLTAPGLPEQWLDADTRVGAPTTLLLGPEPIIAPQQVVLVSSSQAGKSVRLATDGLRPFAVQTRLP